MKRFPSRTVAVAAYLIGASMASAAIIGSTGYEGPPTFENGYYYTYSFDYAGYGNGGPNNDLGGAPVNAAATVEAGIGVGLSGAFQLLADATAVPVSGQPYPGPADPVVQYSYWGMGGGNGLAIVNVPTSSISQIIGSPWTCAPQGFSTSPRRWSSPSSSKCQTTRLGLIRIRTAT